MTSSTSEQPTTRLLVDGHTFDVGSQGTTTYLAGILNALPEAFGRLTGRNLTIYCATRSPDSCRRFLTVPHTHIHMNGGFLRRNLIDLYGISRSISADVTLSQYVRPLRLHGSSVSIIHDVLFLDFPEMFSWSYRQARRLFFGWSARNSDVVATVSEYSRDRIAHWFGIPGDRIKLIPNGVEALSRPDVVNSETAPGTKLLCVSRFEERKRQLWCIRAACDLAAEGLPVDLDLVGTGEGPYAELVKAEADNAAARGISVRLHGQLTNDELELVWAEADLVLFPSACEGFGLPVIEAAARGIPCVVSNNTALAELRYYFAGQSFDDSDYAPFLAALRKAIEDLPQVSAEARLLAPRVAEAFTWTAAAEKLVAALQDERVI